MDFHLFDVSQPIIIYEDNQSTIKLAHNPENTKRIKHLDIKSCFIKEKIDRGVVKIEYMQTSEQQADIFAKPLPKVKFVGFSSNFTIVTENKEAGASLNLNWVTNPDNL